MTSSRIALGAAVLVLACAGSRSDQRSDTTASPQAVQKAQGHGASVARAADLCPMDVPDTKVSASDTAQGEALTFTTSSGQVDELRRRVRALADMHNGAHATSGVAESGTGAADEVQHLEGHHGGARMMSGARATVEDVDNGARVDIVPSDPSQADQVRSMVRMHADRMQNEGCAMMMHGGGR